MGQFMTVILMVFKFSHNELHFKNRSQNLTQNILEASCFIGTLPKQHL